MPLLPPTAVLQPSSFRSNFITPAVIGSLPAGLSQVERASLARMGTSPAAARFQELPAVSASILADLPCLAHCCTVRAVHYEACAMLQCTWQRLLNALDG